MVRRCFLAVLALVLLTIPLAAVFAQDTAPVGTREVSGVGTILTDTDGRTLYTWAGDEAGVSKCSDACANAWPPATVDDASMAIGMMDMAEGLGTIQRADGSYQLTWNNWPLYRFVRDTAPGDANGIGVTAFGALWSVVEVDPSMIM